MCLPAQIDKVYARFVTAGCRVSFEKETETRFEAKRLFLSPSLSLSFSLCLSLSVTFLFSIFDDCRNDILFLFLFLANKRKVPESSNAEHCVHRTSPSVLRFSDKLSKTPILLMLLKINWKKNRR